MRGIGMKAFCSRELVPWISSCLVITSCFGASNDLEGLVRSFPDVKASRFRPDLAAGAANAFILAGEKACSEILNRLAISNHDLSGPERAAEFAQFEELNRKICFLCRLLYVPRPGAEPLQPPRLGAMVKLPYESMDILSWPYLPFAITNGIPLSMNLGYARLGISERAKNYLAYCRSNGTFRAEPFTQPTFQSASNALQRVFDSAAWKRLRWKDSGFGWSYELDEHQAQEMLWKQVKNMNLTSPTSHLKGDSSR
jgi:hypothetical protein